jgi:hypothetical protein
LKVPALKNRAWLLTATERRHSYQLVGAQRKSRLSGSGKWEHSKKDSPLLTAGEFQLKCVGLSHQDSRRGTGCLLAPKKTVGGQQDCLLTIQPKLPRPYTPTQPIDFLVLLRFNFTGLDLFSQDAFELIIKGHGFAA